MVMFYTVSHFVAIYFDLNVMVKVHCI